MRAIDCWVLILVVIGIMIYAYGWGAGALTALVAGITFVGVVSAVDREGDED